MLRTLMSKVVKVIKKRDFEFDKKITNLVLFRLVLYKSFDLIRGLILLRKIAFVGSGTTLLSTSMVNCGKGLSIGSYCYIDALGEEGLVFGDSVSIGGHSIIKVSGTYTDIGKVINIGSNVGIGEFAHLGGAGGLFIDDNTIIGPYFSVHPENHNFSEKQSLIRMQGVTRKGIIVGSNCWIGAKVTILDGSSVGRGCVIAAGAVVNGEFPDNVVIGGVPARILRKR